MNLIAPITSIHIENFRGIRDLHLELNEQVTVLFGPNAAGKTTVIDALAIGLGAIVSRVPRAEGRSFKKRGDIRVPWMNREDLKEMVGVELPFARISLTSANGVAWDVHKLRASRLDKLPSPSIGLKHLHSMLDARLKQALDGGQADVNAQAALPLVAAYGTERAVTPVPLRQRDFSKEFHRLEAYGRSLLSLTKFRDVFEWFIVAEDEERRQRERLHDFNYRYPPLECVRRAVERAGLHCANPRIETKPYLRMLVDYIHRDGSLETIDISSLSDGYRTHFSLVVDIARRMVQLNPSDNLHASDRLTSSEAVILIDEIDLHLDPPWQARVVEGLQKAFPHAQFVLTTHSEQVIGSVPAHCVRRLISGEGELLVENVRFAQGASSERILIELMGAKERVPGEVTTQLSQYLALVDQGDGGDPQALALRHQLNSLLGDDERLRQADMEMEKRRILAELTSSRP